MNTPYIDESKPSTTLADFLGAPVTMFKDAFTTTPMSDSSLNAVLDDIRGGRWEKPVAEIRKTYHRVLDETGDANKASTAIVASKRKLPSFLISGTAENRKEGNKTLRHSGLLQIDFDHLGESLPAIREQMEQDPYLAFGFISPSGDGLKCGMRIDGQHHLESFLAAAAYFRDQYDQEIDGSVKDRLRLCFVSHDPNMWINNEAIVFDVAASNLTQTLSTNSSSSLILHPTSYTPTPYTLHNTCDSVLENIKARQDAMERLQREYPRLVKLYEDIVEPRFQAEAHRRNEFVVKAVKFLYHAVAAGNVLPLVGCFYDANRALFNDAREQHIKEATAQLGAVMETYTQTLSDGERKIYEALLGAEKDVFRICRDLAELPEPEREPMTFYLGFDHLADRITTPEKQFHGTQTQRVMQRFEGYGLLKLTKVGTKRTNGKPGVSSTYKWLLAPNSEHDTKGKI